MRFFSEPVRLRILKFNSWGLNEADSKNPVKISGKIPRVWPGRSELRVARLALRNMRHITVELKGNEVEIETFDAYISHLRLQAIQCVYKVAKAEGDMNSKIDERIIEQLIAETGYKDVQKELLGKDKKN